MFKFVTGCDDLKQWINGSNLRSSSIDMTTYEIVNGIKSLVENDGDKGLTKLTKKFDQVSLTPNELRVSESAIQAAYQAVDPAYIESLKKAAKNIEDYHLNQRPKNWEKSSPDQTYGVQFSALDSVGLYVPGGRAAYPSSVLMTAIPAKIANCPRIVMVSPPTGGQIPASVLVAADLSGVNEIYQIGGAQAVFALAYGTESISPVDKIVGPGNKFVTAAKQLVYGVVDIDKPAGPSEVCVYVDELRYAPYAASEMLAQLEHDPDAAAICIATSGDIADAVNMAAAKQVQSLTRRAIIDESKQNAVIAFIDTHDEALAAINDCASEHLVLVSDAANELRPHVKHAGSIFCGPYTPVALGDYYAGPNHVLPTARSARFASPLGVMDYMKYSSYLSYSDVALKEATMDLQNLTTAEGFDAHFNSVQVRINE
jgi:histidinol dehydrogenase